MSVAVCLGPAAPAFRLPNWRSLADEYELAVEHADDERPAQLDIWNAIQADKEKAASSGDTSSKPYVHPLVRRSSSLMSQKSLEICTESLGSESGSADFSFLDDDDVACFRRPPPPVPGDKEEAALSMGEVLRTSEHRLYSRALAEERRERKELVAVNYHCSSGARSPPRSFPPPLPSMSRRDGPCLQMRPHRLDGRLVVEAVPVRSHNYLHAQRRGGQLRLSFINCSVRDQRTTESLLSATAPNQEQVVAVPQGEQVQELTILATKELYEEEELVDEEEEEMAEEEVEVVDRGTVVEVKVSTQPQMPICGGAATKVHRSTLVINKFVGSTPLTDQSRSPGRTASDEPATDDIEPKPTPRRVPSSTSTTTLAAAVAVASTASGTRPGVDDDAGRHLPAAASADMKLLFTSRRRDKQELLLSVRRCRQLRQKPLFILEPYCIATS